jgi:hypothetical protein
MVRFRVKLANPKPGANRSDSDGAQGGSRLARIGGRVNRNLELVSLPSAWVVLPRQPEK